MAAESELLYAVRLALAGVQLYTMGATPTGAISSENAMSSSRGALASSAAVLGVTVRMCEGLPSWKSKLVART